MISMKAKKTVTTSSTSPYCLMSILLPFVPATTTIIILSQCEAILQRAIAVRGRPPLPGTLLESFNQKETLTFNFSITIVKMRKVEPNKCPPRT